MHHLDPGRFHRHGADLRAVDRGGRNVQVPERHERAQGHSGRSLGGSAGGSIGDVVGAFAITGLLARGLRSREEARRTGEYVDAGVVLAGWRRRLESARQPSRPSELPGPPDLLAGSTSRHVALSVCLRFYM